MGMKEPSYIFQDNQTSKQAITCSLHTTISILTLAINVSSENSDPANQQRTSINSKN